MRLLSIFLSLVLVYVCLSLPAQAASNDTVYIRDTLYVPMRSGQSSEYRIIDQAIVSGTPLEKLEENEATGYTRVRMKDGKEGWIQTQYLISEPIAREQLASAKARLEQLSGETSRLKSQLSEASQERDSLSRNNAELSQENAQLQEELARIQALAADVLAIDARNEELMSEQTALNAEIEALLSEQEDLRDDKYQSWFLRGAGVVFLGLLFGFWIARRLYNRRASAGWV